MRKDFLRKTNCRVCSGSNLVKVLDLGKIPLSNAFLKEKELNNPEKKFPLVVYFCRNCGLLQLLDIISPELLFRNYYYMTSTSKPLADHFVKFGRILSEKFIKSKNDLTIDIGGNDAVLLESIKNKCRVLNIEPAKNIAKISREKGVETVSEFFSEKLARDIFKKYGTAKVVTASNVFAHADNLDDFIKGVKILIGNNGIFVIEAHWVANLLGLAGIGGFDQIYHEHLSYFSLSALQKLFNRYHLKIFDAKLISIHGQSLQVYVACPPAEQACLPVGRGKNYKVSRRVKALLGKEKKLGISDVKTYFDFAKRVAENKTELKSSLLRLKKKNKKIVGYGAPAKGNILLNYCGINNKILDFIVEDSPLKQGLYTPGNHIPIYSAEKLKEIFPDYVLLLAWNYTDAILKKEKALIERGVKFILPVPKVKIINPPTLIGGRVKV